MRGIGALEQLTEPGTLRFGIARKVEHDGDAARQEITNVWPERVPQPGRKLGESRYIDDLARKQAFQELVLYDQNGIFPPGQISRERGLSSCHLAAEENQLR